MTKLKRLLGMAIILGCAAWALIQRRTDLQLQEENRALRDQMGELKIENQRLVSASGATNSPAISDEQFKELLRLRGEVGKLREKLKEASKPQNPTRVSHADGATPSSFPEAHPEDVIPRESWQFAGYATPESALQSTLWALSKGDADNVLNSLTGDAQTAVAKQYEGKSDAEIAADFSRQISNIKAPASRSEKTTPEGDVTFGVWSEGQNEGAGQFRSETVLRFQNVGGEWKFSWF